MWNRACERGGEREYKGIGEEGKCLGVYVSE